MGRIKKWNDSRLASLNPGVALPNQDILVVHRSDGSGTTYIFTDYLTAASPAWKTAVGKGKEVKWPVGLGAKGNEGVAGQVKQTPGAIGYVELAYAKQNNLPVAAIRNKSGQFIAASVAAVTARPPGGEERPPNPIQNLHCGCPGADSYRSLSPVIDYQTEGCGQRKEARGLLNWLSPTARRWPARSTTAAPAEMASTVATGSDRSTQRTRTRHGQPLQGFAEVSGGRGAIGTGFTDIHRLRARDPAR